MKVRSVIVFAVGLWMMAGCSTRLETGYLPRKLGASNIERRGFYAMPFTREARAAEMEREAEFDARRPRPGY